MAIAAAAAAAAVFCYQGIVHGDIKPANCAFDGSMARLIDFGTAWYLGTSGYLGFFTTFNRPPEFCTPEGSTHAGMQAAASSKIDVYQTLLTIFMICSDGGNAPKGFDSQATHVTAIRDCKWDEKLAKMVQEFKYRLANVDDEDARLLVSFLQRGLTQDPKDRASFAQLLNHPFISKEVLMRCMVVEQEQQKWEQHREQLLAQLFQPLEPCCSSASSSSSEVREQNQQQEACASSSSSSSSSSLSLARLKPRLSEGGVVAPGTPLSCSRVHSFAVRCSASSGSPPEAATAAETFSSSSSSSSSSGHVTSALSEETCPGLECSWDSSPLAPTLGRPFTAFAAAAAIPVPAVAAAAPALPGPLPSPLSLGKAASLPAVFAMPAAAAAAAGSIAATSALSSDSSAASSHPSTISSNTSAFSSHHSNAASSHTSAISSDSRAISSDPNAISSDSSAISSDPNAISSTGSITSAAAAAAGTIAAEGSLGRPRALRFLRNPIARVGTFVKGIFRRPKRAAAGCAAAGSGVPGADSLCCPLVDWMESKWMSGWEDKGTGGGAKASDCLSDSLV